MTHQARLSRTLSRYIAIRFAGSFLLVLAALGGIVLLGEIVELLRRASSRPEVTFQLVMEMAILKFPHSLEQVVPFVTLFGGMLVFWRLTRNSELIVARASGFSVWQFLAPAVTMAVLIGVFFIAAINPLGSTMQLRFEQLEGDHFKGRTSDLAISRSGMWLRQSGKTGKSVIHSPRINPVDMTLRTVTVYLFDEKDQFSGRLDAPEARLTPGRWELKDVMVTKPGKPQERQASYTLPTDWTTAKIKDSFSPPETLSFWHLPGFIAVLDKAGFTATRHRVHWHSLLAIPLMLGAMVMVAACFSLRIARRGGVALVIGAGILFTFFILFLTDVVHALGLADTIPAALAAWTPAGVTLLTGLSILLYIEEG
ncbi:MAG: LPS export ABC transporter permease LptG [Alphaproteobacteria bacterium]|nr:LPS export ABC transporter permease LptG [Alphaproteobacteria bacterium]